MQPIEWLHELVPAVHSPMREDGSVDPGVVPVQAESLPPLRVVAPAARQRASARTHVRAPQVGSQPPVHDVVIRKR